MLLIDTKSQKFVVGKELPKAKPLNGGAAANAKAEDAEVCCGKRIAECDSKSGKAA